MLLHASLVYVRISYSCNHKNVHINYVHTQVNNTVGCKWHGFDFKKLVFCAMKSLKLLLKVCLQVLICVLTQAEAAEPSYLYLWLGMRKPGLWAHKIWPCFYNLKLNNFLYLHNFFTCTPMFWEHYRLLITFTKKEICKRVFCTHKLYFLIPGYICCHLRSLYSTCYLHGWLVGVGTFMKNMSSYMFWRSHSIIEYSCTKHIQGCNCKSTCQWKGKCPCKTSGHFCSDHCRCKSRAGPCKNRAYTVEGERRRWLGSLKRHCYCPRQPMTCDCKY